MPSEDIRLIISVSLPCLMVLVGILINNSRLGDVGNRIADLKGDISDRFAGTNDRFSNMNDRLSGMNGRITDLKQHMDQRFDDFSKLMEARFDLQDEKLYRVEQVLDARLKHIEERRG